MGGREQEGGEGGSKAREWGSDDVWVGGWERESGKGG